MATVSFLLSGSSVAIEVTPIPGTLKEGGGHDDRGGDVVDNVRAGISREGELECKVEDTGDQSLATLLSLRSGVGAGSTTVSGDDIETAAECLVDVSIAGDAVQTANIKWRGTPA